MTREAAVDVACFGGLQAGEAPRVSVRSQLDQDDVIDYDGSECNRNQIRFDRDCGRRGGGGEDEAVPVGRTEKRQSERAKTVGGPLVSHWACRGRDRPQGRPGGVKGQIIDGTRFRGEILRNRPAGLRRHIGIENAIELPGSAWDRAGNIDAARGVPWRQRACFKVTVAQKALRVRRVNETESQNNGHAAEEGSDHSGVIFVEGNPTKL